MWVRERPLWLSQRCCSPWRAAIRPPSWRLRKFWRSNIMMSYNAGSIRSAYAWRCEPPPDRKKADRCRCLSMQAIPSGRNLRSLWGRLPWCTPKFLLRTRLEAGRQLYVIYPLIDESEKLDAKAAAAEYELWRERLHPFRCDLLHGRIPPSEKQEIMERFRNGETSALISTTVLEVGVD